MPENALLFAGAAAVVGLVASCWNYVRSIYQQVFSRLIVNVSAAGYQSDALQLYFREKFKASRFGPRNYTAWLLHVRPRRRNQLVAMEVIGQTGRLYWLGRRPVWVSKSKDKGEFSAEDGVTSRGYESNVISLTFFRGMFDADKLILDACEHYNQRIVTLEDDDMPGRKRHYVRHIYGTAGKPMGSFQSVSSHNDSPGSAGDTRACMHHRPLGWEFSDLGYDTTAAGSAVDQLALSDDALAMVREATFWKENEAWYRDRCIPWRRGWLLHGEPGTGKTALIRAIAEDLDLPVYVYDLASLYNEELQAAWSKMLSEVPCMAVIEDIDAVFDKRRNVVGRDQNLTFDCLLNCLDGIERSNGLFLVITTNRLDRIDEALGRPNEDDDSTRPGRVDRILHMGPLDFAARLKLASRVLRDWPDRQLEIVEAGDGDTAAQFQERCSREALSMFWGDKFDAPPPQRLPEPVEV